jgi:hypothetical protein
MPEINQKAADQMADRIRNAVVFRDFVKLCMKLDLYGKELVAISSVGRILSPSTGTAMNNYNY